MRHPTHWQFSLRNASGLAVARSPLVANVLAREGESLILGQFFQNNPLSAPVYFEVGLCNSSPTTLTTAASLSGEPSGGGYQRQRLTRDTNGWPSLAIPPTNTDGPYQLSSTFVTFTAIGASIGPFSSAFLIARVQLGDDPNVLTPFLVSAAATTNTSIPSGNALDVTIALTLEPLS